VKAFVWDYISFAQSNPEYDFIVSLDGSDSETIEYCKAHHIPLLYSDNNEGVGISKNRVIESFKDYDYYFFIEDDIELLNPEVFDIHIKLSQELDIPHFSLFEARRIRNQQNVLEHDGYHIIQAMYGGAPFNFFSKKGLDIVGGFHTHFAQFKRFGHTEHTYRFVHNGLSEYPFQLIEECLEGYFRWNDPISRIKISVEVSENRLFVDEEELIAQKLKFFPVETLCAYHSLNSENIQNLDNIIMDSKVEKHKKRFYRKLAMIDFLRDVKNIPKNIIKKLLA
jgi:hypothetical protein